jgi:hypothetical protein
VTYRSSAARGENWLGGLVSDALGSRAVLRGYRCLTHRNSPL